MHHIDLILTITGGLGAALVLGFAMHRFGLSPVVGYLLAGIVVGPRTPGFVADERLAGELAEIGVILLMFGVGLQFHVQELMAVRRVAVPGALGQITVATALGALAAHGWGYGLSGGVVFGLAISVASTVVLVRVLSDHRDLHTLTGRTAVGWLVVEDVFTVLALVALPLLFAPRAEGGPTLWVSLATAVVKLVALTLVVAVVGRRLIPRVFEYAAKTHSRELFTLTVLVTAMGIAVAAAHFFGASMALGAFLAGMIVGQSDFSARAASDALPMRDAFAVLFFVSVGMLFDPAQLWRAPGQIALTLAIVLGVKPLSAWLIVRALGKPPRLAASVAVALAQIGEFSFVLASISQSLGILPGDAASNLVAAAMISISLNPVLYKWARRLTAAQRENGEVEALDTPPSDHDLAIIIGNGPAGQVLRRILVDNEIECTTIELNVEAVQLLKQRGHRAVYGDATRSEVLKAAGIEHAQALFLTSATLEGACDVIRAAKELNAKVRVFARTGFLADVGPLSQAGAHSVISAEGEVALAMATGLLEELGASADQIDRERNRVMQSLRKWIGPEAAPPPPVRSREG